MIYNINFDPFLDSIFLFSSIIVLIIFSCFFTVSKKNNFILVNNIIGINFILFLVLFILLIINNPFTNVCSFSGTIINDLSSIYCKMVTVISSILCFYLSFSYIKNYQINHFEFFIIIGIAIFSLNLLVISHDFLIAYISIELQSLSFYIMACFKRQSAYSTESGIKYFLLGSFSSTILLFGISLIYGLFGTLNFHLLNLLIFEFNYLFFLDKIGFILIFIGLLFKLSAAPFHFWLPDVYEGAPIISTVFFAVVPKISILILIFKILIIYFHNNIILLFLLSSILSIIIGSFVALKQKRLKKLLAYSSINHIGYLLFGIALFSIESICATFFYVLTYMITGLCIWSIITCLKTKNSDNYHTFSLANMSGLFKINPLLSFILSVCLFSLAGIPPFIGFYAKINIFQASINSGFILISCFFMIISVISTFYYIRMVKLVFFENMYKKWHFFVNIKSIHAVIISITFYLIIILFFNPFVLDLIAYKIILSLIF